MAFLPVLKDHSDFQLDGSGWIATIVAILLAALFIFFAAKLLGEREGYGTALLVAIVGGILWSVAQWLVGGIVGLLLAIALWALVAAAFYRTRWLKGLVIGLLAGLLAYLARLAVGYLLR